MEETEIVKTNTIYYVIIGICAIVIIAIFYTLFFPSAPVTGVGTNLPAMVGGC